MKYGIKLNPGHVRLGNVLYMAPGTLTDGLFFRRRLVRFRVVAETKEAPSVGFGETLTVLQTQVNSIEHPIEKASSGRLGAGPIRESRIQQAGQLLYKHGALRELARLHVRLEVL